MSSYEVMYEDHGGWTSWFLPLMRGYRKSCCKCGLVEDIEFRVTYNGVAQRAKKYRAYFRCRQNYELTKNTVSPTEVWSGWVTWTPSVQEKCPKCGFIHGFTYRAVEATGNDRHGYELTTLPSEYKIQFRIRQNKRSTAALKRKKHARTSK